MKMQRISIEEILKKPSVKKMKELLFLSECETIGIVYKLLRKAANDSDITRHINNLPEFLGIDCITDPKFLLDALINSGIVINKNGKYYVSITDRKDDSFYTQRQIEQYINKVKQLNANRKDVVDYIDTIRIKKGGVLPKKELLKMIDDINLANSHFSDLAKKAKKAGSHSVFTEELNKLLNKKKTVPEKMLFKED